MSGNYLEQLIEHFYKLDMKQVDEATNKQISRAMLDYIGCYVHAASRDCCSGLSGLIASMGALGGTNSEGIASCTDTRSLSPAYEAFHNATRTSNIEMDDGSGNGASVHPGLYVFSAALAAWNDSNAGIDDFKRAVLFGYDICIRMGLLATEKVRELGLHGPGFVGGLAAAAAAGTVYGLTEEQLMNAVTMTASLLPVCPFISFIEGADSKDLYGGWGVFLAMFCVNAARRGLKGPKQVFDGVKSLNSIFAGDKGKDVTPGEHYYINGITFKEFSACYSVQPAVSVIMNLKEEREIDVDKIKSVVVYTYPYSYDLNEGVCGRELNSSSARLCLPHAVASALIDGKLDPEAFTEKTLKDEKYAALREKITIRKNDSYGSDSFGTRGCTIDITMEDGSVINGETLSVRWKKTPTTEQLLEKFNRITRNALTEDMRLNLIDHILKLESREDIEKILEILKDVKDVKDV